MRKQLTVTQFETVDKLLRNVFESILGGGENAVRGVSAVRIVYGRSSEHIQWAANVAYLLKGLALLPTAIRHGY